MRMRMRLMESIVLLFLLLLDRASRVVVLDGSRFVILRRLVDEILRLMGIFLLVRFLLVVERRLVRRGDGVRRDGRGRDGMGGDAGRNRLRRGGVRSRELMGESVRCVSSSRRARMMILSVGVHELIARRFSSREGRSEMSKGRLLLLHRRLIHRVEMDEGRWLRLLVVVRSVNG